MPVEQISPADLAARLETVCLLDVREDWELQTAQIAGALHIPMDAVPDEIEKLRHARDGKDLVVMCRSGARSQNVAEFLNQSGFCDVFNLDGGILAWSEQVDPSVPRY